MTPSDNLHWWQSGIIYQVYPRSFQDSNRDGVGDLAGVLQRLDYLHEIGVTTVWLSPIFPSPMHDFGYDVADYTGINPLFGTLDDFDRLLAAAHQRGMRLVLDLVPNHTSDEHAWFVESRSSRTNPKRDWYIWRDPAPDGGLPNNWLSFFGGPAWTLDPHSGQYYLHQFVRQQPELNYRNPEVLRAMLGEMRVWLERGIDGFRVDVIWLMIKDAMLRDEPPDPNWDGVEPFRSLQHIYSADQPEVHAIVRAMRALLDEYGDRVLIGEIYLPYDRLMDYYGAPLANGLGDECHMPYNFHLLATPWNAAAVRDLIDRYEAALPAYGWPNWVLGNHDQRRLASRVGRAQARVATMLLLTLRGTPTCYYGDEIGMVNVPIPLDRIVDPQAVNQPEIADIVGRDPVRTPMQWDGSPNAGFCAPEVSPWLPLADDYAHYNVAAERSDPNSPLVFFQALTSLRKNSPALLGGACQTIPVAAESVLVYRRSHADERLVVILNFADKPEVVDLSALGESATAIADTRGPLHESRSLRAFYLAPDEGVILRLEP